MWDSNPESIRIRILEDLDPDLEDPGFFLDPDLEDPGIFVSAA